MKFIHFCILAGTVAFTGLFYFQSAGLNYLLFNLLLVGLTAAANRNLLSRPSWLLVAAASLFSSFYVFWFGTWLPLLANWCSLLVLAGLSFAPDASLLIAGFSGWMSMWLSAVRGAIPQRILRPVTETGDASGKAHGNRFPLVILALAITTVFFFLYRESNPLFEKLTDEIDLDFISVPWLLFTLLGFIWMYGFFVHRSSEKLLRLDSRASDDLPPISEEEHNRAHRFFTLPASTEIFGGTLLFALLNLLLLSVNGVDVFYLWIARKLPAGISVADYLHDGTETLILSIVLAILIILVVFRGYLHFAPGTKWLRSLCYIWIAQNLLMVLTNAQRNWWIIESSGLTRRRIGVYVYLLLCVIGLATTLFKVGQRRSNWFLFRKNAWAFYAVFLFSLPVNWDEWIVRFNLTHFKLLHLNYIDRGYQSELSYTSLGTLFQFYAQEVNGPPTDHMVFNETVVQSMYQQYTNLKQEVQYSDWRSYCYSKQHNLQIIQQLIQQGKIPASVKLTPPRMPL